MYKVRITSSGKRHLDLLPAKVRGAAFECIFNVIVVNPCRVGKPLLGELSGLYSARRGDYRIVYEVDGEANEVVVHHVPHRGEVYQRRA